MEQTREIHILITDVEAAGALLARARVTEMRLEDARPVLKQDAVKRIMHRDGISATPAEKIVETDEAYMVHRRAQYDAVVQTQTAWARYEACRLRAQLAVNLAATTGVL